MRKVRWVLVGVYTDTVTWREVLWDAIVAAQYQWNEKKIHTIT